MVYVKILVTAAPRSGGWLWGGDPGVKVTHQVYNRMSLLLKSLVTVARVTPAYKLSRRQGPDSYVICYRVMLGDPGTPLTWGDILTVSHLMPGTGAG